MSTLTALNAADNRLAGTIDTLTAAVAGVGAATLAAKQRLAAALDAARQRLASELTEVGEKNRFDVTCSKDGSLFKDPATITKYDAFAFYTTGDLTKDSEEFAYGFSASPDGRRSAYHNSYTVYVADADGTNARAMLR